MTKNMIDDTIRLITKINMRLDNLIKIFVIPFLLSLSVLLLSQIHAFAQTAADDTREQREAYLEDQKERLQELEDLRQKPRTAEEVLEMLKKRAEEKLKEKRRKMLLKTKISAGATSGFQTNPASVQNETEKGDSVYDENFSFKWVPSLTDRLNADVGYSLYDQNFTQQENIDNENHTISSALKYYALQSGKLLLEPGVKYEWLIYPFDAASSNEQIKSFLKLTYYLNNFWSVGGEYEYSIKEYDKAVGRDTSGTNTISHREDEKNSFEVWIKRVIGKHSIKLKEKSFINNSNDDYQDYYDYDSHRGYITLTGSFLKDDKLFVSITSDYEFKRYFNRPASTTARKDHIWQHNMYLYYPINKILSLNYSFTFKESTSNAAAGEFTDIANKLGFSLSF